MTLMCYRDSSGRENPQVCMVCGGLQAEAGGMGLSDDGAVALTTPLQ